MSETPPTTSPIKLGFMGDNMAVATPSGGMIFNPFHKEFINRLGQSTLSPGIFARSHSPPASGDINAATPNYSDKTFILSPDIQGDLFPAEIDENPTLQLKLQERLDRQCDDDDVQHSIHSFFKSNLIAPSPDTVAGTSSDWTRRILPRTSSMLPTVTPKGKKKTSFTDASAIMMSDVEVQTALSIPIDVDLEGLLRQASLSTKCEHCCLGAGTEAQPMTASAIVTPVKPRRPSSLVTFQMNPANLAPEAVSKTYSISLSACSVNRPQDAYPHSSLFLCMACHKPHSLSRYTRRSLFVEALDAIDDVPSTNSDEQDNNNTQTAMSTNRSDHNSISTLSHAVPAVANVGAERRDINGQLLEEAAALQFGIPPFWMRFAHNDSDSDDDDMGRVQQMPSDYGAMKENVPPEKNVHSMQESPPHVEEAHDVENIACTPIRSTLHLDVSSISPLVAGRTSPLRFRSLRTSRPPPLSFDNMELLSPSVSPILSNSPCISPIPRDPLNGFLLLSPQCGPRRSELGDRSYMDIS